MDIMLESDDDGTVLERAKPSSKAQPSAKSRAVPVAELLRRRCRCGHAACFTQFQGEEAAVESIRREFQSLDGPEKVRG